MRCVQMEDLRFQDLQLGAWLGLSTKNLAQGESHLAARAHPLKPLGS